MYQVLIYDNYGSFEEVIINNVDYYSLQRSLEKCEISAFSVYLSF